MQSSKLNHLSCRQSHIMPLSPILKPLIVSTKADLLNCDWPGRTGCLVLQLGSGAQESMMHGSVPAEASFFFSILYLLVQGSGVFFFLVFTMHLVSTSAIQCFTVLSCLHISDTVKTC